MKKIKQILLTITLLSLICVLPICASASTQVDDFTLEILKELSIMEGDQYGNLELDREVTRAEFTKMAVKASKYKNSVALNLSISPYKDVTYKKWYAPYIKAASDNSLIKGYSDGSFKPENNVLYEEAVTVLLRLLGYTDDDFGASWPYGQMGIAEAIGLCDDIGCSVGENMDRSDVAGLINNFLRTYQKGTTTEYINTLDYSFAEDVILIATANEDSSVGSDKIYTSAGTYKINKWFNYGYVGKKGDALLKKGDELILFKADEQQESEYVIYQTLDDKIIIVTDNGLETLDIDKNLTVYNKTAKTSINALINTLAAGDTIKTYSNESGVLDYGFVKTDELKGPYTVASSGWINDFGFNNPTVNKNGLKTQASEVNVNDIIYYSEKLNTVWVYSDKVTGIYEKAIPNKDNPTSIQVSGVTYPIEGVNAFSKLSTGGEYILGDTVTLLLGKNGEIADVGTAKAESSSDYVYGYLAETGTKTFEDSSGSYSSYYATVVKANGEAVTYAVKSNYSAIKNKPVTVTFSGKYATVSVLNTSSGVSGTFSSDNKTVGNQTLSENVKILEVSTTETSEDSVYGSVLLPRLDGVKVKSSQVLLANKNAKGQIDELILLNVTGDLNSYGIVTEANSTEAGGSYKVDVAGNVLNVSGSKTYSVTKWQPCKITYEGNAVDTLTPLKKLTTAAKSITETTLKSGTSEYLLWDKAVVYIRKNDYNYMMISLKDLIETQSDYTVYAYYDTTASSGGRVRILTAIPK